MSIIWDTQSDWDNSQSESANIVHESFGATDLLATELKKGYSMSSPYKSSNLVGFWPLQEDSGTEVNDISGNSHDATSYNGVSPEQPGILETSSYFFDASGTYVETDNDFPVSGSSARTISVWFKTSKDSGWYQSNNSWPAMVCSDESGNTNGSVILEPFDGVNEQVGVHFWTNSLTTGKKIEDYGLNEWHHMVFVMTGAGEQRIYMNGTLENSSTYSISTPTGPYVFGERQYTGDNFYGYLADVRIYDTAFTDTEVATLYDRASADGTYTSGTKVEDAKLNYVTVDGSINGSVDLTIYQDESGGTTADNQDTVSITAPGAYTIDNLTSVAGSSFWFDATLIGENRASTSLLDSVTLDSSISDASYSEVLQGAGETAMPSVKLTTTDTSTNLNSDNTVVPWTDAEYIDSTFIFDSANNQITVEEDGIYEMRAVLYTYHQGSSTRSNPVARFLLNGSTYLDGYGASGYARNNENHLHSSNSPHNIEELTAGDNIQVETFREGGGGTRTMVADTCMFYMKKLPKEAVISNSPVRGRETGDVAASNQGTVAICRLEDTETLSIEECGLTLTDGQPAPTSLNMEIVTMDNSGGYTSQKTVISGDGSTVHNELRGKPFTTWQNNTGGASTVAVIVDNQTASSQDIIAYVEGQIE